MNWFLRTNLLFLVLVGVSCESTRELPAPVSSPDSEALSTYSIVAVDLENGDLGVAVQSKYFGVGPVVPWVESGVGAIATQSWANTSYGPEGLRLLRKGKSVDETLETLLSSDTHHEWRQVGLVDTRGKARSYTGSKCLAWAGGKTAPGYAVQGNILVSRETVDAMARAFESSSGQELAERLMRALEAGQKAGGDVRGKQSAALHVARRGAGPGNNDRYLWLSIDDHPTPVRELRRLLERSLRRDALSRARVAQRSGKIADAHKLFLEAEKAEPNNPSIALERARLEFQLRRAQAADETIQNAIRKQPDYDNLYYQAAQIYLEAGAVAKGLAMLKKLLNMSPAYRERLRAEVEDGASVFHRHREEIRRAKIPFTNDDQ